MTTFYILWIGIAIFSVWLCWYLTRPIASHHTRILIRSFTIAVACGFSFAGGGHYVVVMPACLLLLTDAGLTGLFVMAGWLLCITLLYYLIYYNATKQNIF